MLAHSEMAAYMKIVLCYIYITNIDDAQNCDEVFNIIMKLLAESDLELML